ncbi:nad(p)-binding rossmann-fold superfamily protein [Citrus sinensis]|uniref:Nad(P)-binding rossmann-fold superfamily protein n=1 Tax=Citrus sinensis TaxID=2711 RepID=A0ACB8HSE9_CITSI|nr:nad(p)-binding rossmann-fold superfamily protein [Citrus sinensis]
MKLWLFNRKGPSGFSASSTAEEVTDGIDGSGLTAIVTGATSGIGTETARVLALRGVHVVMGVRDIAAGKDVKETIVKEIPSAKVDAMELDLSHFLLTNLLLDTMKKTARKSGGEGRIINVSSEGHRLAYHEGIRFDKINDPSGYNGFRAYSQSKLANILHANELARRLKEDGVDITANSVHPGAIATNIIRHNSLFRSMNTILHALPGIAGKCLLKNVQQGTATTCYVALHPQVKGKSGFYFSDSKVAQPSSQALNVEIFLLLYNCKMQTMLLIKLDLA